MDKENRSLLILDSNSFSKPISNIFKLNCNWIARQCEELCLKSLEVKL